MNVATVIEKSHCFNSDVVAAVLLLVPPMVSILFKLTLKFALFIGQIECTRIMLDENS